MARGRTPYPPISFESRPQLWRKLKVFATHWRLGDTVRARGTCSGCWQRARLLVCLLPSGVATPGPGHHTHSYASLLLLFWLTPLVVNSSIDVPITFWHDNDHAAVDPLPNIFLCKCVGPSMQQGLATPLLLPCLLLKTCPACSCLSVALSPGHTQLSTLHNIESWVWPGDEDSLNVEQGHSCVLL